MAQISASIVRAFVDFGTFNEAVTNSVQRLSADKFKMARDMERAAWDRFEETRKRCGVEFSTVACATDQLKAARDERDFHMIREIERRAARKAKAALQAA
jgi:hypothetical protein